MVTTALRIEILIVGFQGSIWLLVLLVGSPEELRAQAQAWRDQIAYLEHVAVPATVLLLGWCYSFGAAIDGVAGAIDGWKWIYRWIFRLSPGEPEKSASLRLKFPEAYRELVQTDFELRLLRSTALNLLIFGGVAWYTGWPWAVVGGSLFAAIASWLAWYRRRQRIAIRKEALHEAADAAA